MDNWDVGKLSRSQIRRHSTIIDVQLWLPLHHKVSLYRPLATRLLFPSLHTLAQNPLERAAHQCEWTEWSRCLPQMALAPQYPDTYYVVELKTVWSVQ